MEENMNEMVETSEEKSVVEAEPQETTETAGCEVYVVNANDSLLVAKKGIISGASYVLGASLMTAAIGGVTFAVSKVKDKIKKRKEAKKLDAEIEAEIDEDECDDQD